MFSSRFRWPRTLVVLVGALTALGLSLVGGALGQAQAPVKTMIQLPERGAYFGAFVSYGGDSVQETATFERRAGKDVAIVGYLTHFTDPALPATFQHIYDMGAVPFHTNSPWIDCAQLKAGALDADIRRWGQFYASLKPKPILVRYMHEMNLNFGNYPWAAFRCGGAEGYVEAYRRVHDLLMEAGATNVQHVWCPNAYWGESDASNHLWFKQYYPGDAYVDWMCVDGYDWYGEYQPDGTKWPQPQTFSHMFGASLDLLESISDRPILLGELGVIEDPRSPTWKPNWIRDALTVQIPARPRIKAIVWSNEQPTYDGETFDFRMESSPATQAAFMEAIAAEYYLSQPLRLTGSGAE
ncbi:MAG: glycosyl hydrolase [Dehalococcoidia bacterium]